MTAYRPRGGALTDQGAATAHRGWQRTDLSGDSGGPGSLVPPLPLAECVLPYVCLPVVWVPPLPLVVCVPRLPESEDGEHRVETDR